VTPDPLRLDEWLAVPADELAERSAVPFTLVETPADLHREFAAEMYRDIARAREEGRRLSLIVPVGPTGHYPLLADRINESRLALDHVTFFGMDEFLDWQGRPLPVEHPFSLEGTFRSAFLERVDAELRPENDDVIFPTPLALDRSAEEIERRGGVEATYGGVGFQGHVAFNEPPASRWTAVTVDELADSRTRVLPLAEDTIIAHAQRRAGGNPFAVPPMAITLGMRELLSAARLRLYLDTGAWKQTILRILLFSEPDVDYPATLVTVHPDLRVMADRTTATAPPDARLVTERHPSHP
jgi:glucosamine-6-phosphate deaminase